MFFSRADNHKRIGRQRTTDGPFPIAAKIDFDGGVLHCDGLKEAFRKFDGDGRGGERQGVGDHLCGQECDASAETARHSPGGGKRGGGLGQIGEDDLQVEPGAIRGGRGLRGEGSILEANRFLCHQFQAREIGIKEAFISGLTVSRKY
jgi:hypothetical protein